MIKNFIRANFIAILMVLSFAAVNFAQTGSNNNFSNITIDNFGQMDEHFYRGAQPKKNEYQQLKDLGVNTVIDLQADPTSYEKAAVEALGMKYVNIPMVDKKYPTAENIDIFLKLANDPATGVFYVHCKGGRHRTGAVGAAYRFTKYGWNYDQVYAEMNKFDFYTRNGHEDFKTFVLDYAAKMKTPAADSTTAVNTVQTIH
jgi:protein tyrosine/serine phosphatase